MKKQVIYPKFIPRLFATTLDLFLLSLIITPVMNFISKYIFIFVFKDFFIQGNIDTSDSILMAEAVKTPEFMEFITPSNSLSYIGILLALHTIIMGTYFIGFWVYKGATPGKLIMRTRIVDADSLEKPTTYQLVKRFFGYITAFFGIWSILFTKQRQAFHDKIAGTVVIKA
jgi:uncharacterized RDD family membrane protein YckC